MPATCARPTGARAETTRRASFFKCSKNANHNLLPDQYLASKKPAHISENLRIRMRYRCRGDALPMRAVWLSDARDFASKAPFRTCDARFSGFRRIYADCPRRSV